MLRQSMQLIAAFPMIAAYAYHTYNHYEEGSEHVYSETEKELSIAENFLKCLDQIHVFTELEARVT